MPTYQFQLHDGPDVPHITEDVQATDIEEARVLADLRLRLSHAFTHVEVELDGVEQFRMRRDSVQPLGRPDAGGGSR